MSAATLPAAPLADFVERLQKRGADLGVNPRNLYSWKHEPRRGVTTETADRLLIRTDYLWFDVWPACEAHTQPTAGCAACVGHHKARRAFTGVPLPVALQ